MTQTITQNRILNCCNNDKATTNDFMYASRQVGIKGNECVYPFCSLSEKQQKLEGSDAIWRDV